MLISSLSPFRHIFGNVAAVRFCSTQNQFRSMMELDVKQAETDSVNSYVSQFSNSLNLREHNYVRSLNREFGPSAYGAFSAKNVKACRGVRGKSFSIRINDTKWRYPKRGRH